MKKDVEEGKVIESKISEQYSNFISERPESAQILPQIKTKGFRTRNCPVLISDQAYQKLKRENSKLMKFNTDCNTRIQELGPLQEEIDNLKKQKYDLEQSKEFLQRRVYEVSQENKVYLEQTQEEYKSQIDNLKKEKYDLEQSKEFLKRRVDELAQENKVYLEQTQEEYKSQIDNLKKEKDDLNQSNILYENKIKEIYERRVDELAQENKVYLEQIQEEYQSQINNLVKEKDDLEQSKVLHENQIKEIYERRIYELSQAEIDYQDRINRAEQKAMNDLEQADSEYRRNYSELQRSLEEEYPNLKKNNECLKKELEMMKIYLNKIKNQDTEPVKENIIDYDCILQVDNFSDISKEGWILKIPQKEEFKLKKCGSVFALVGLYNKGKTFILNQLTGSLFGSGQSCTTEGISMKEVTIDSDRFFVLDTAGTNSPIDLTKIEERDKKITEVFIQDLALNIADYFILVVNDFTSKDQKILKRIDQHVKDQKQFKSIFVIHNFQNVKEEALHNHVWQNQVIRIFSPLEKNGEMLTSVIVRLDDGRAEQRNVPFYKAEYSTHYSLVNNTSDYGIEFNRSSIQLIKDTIKRQICHANTNTLYETLKDKIKVSLSTTTLDITEKENIEIIKCATIDNWATLVPRRGLKFLQQNEFEPIYDFFEANDHYNIILDIPGMSREDIEISLGDHLTTISGNRVKDHQMNTAETHRRFGKFNLEFRIPSGFKSKPIKKPEEFTSGILKLEYPRREKTIWGGN